MKTAISIPDSVFREADELAERLEISRSALYTAAIAEYVARHTSEQITARLDAVYAATDRKGSATPVVERPPMARVDHW